ncbi:hypothetical protein JQN58_17665 [Aneurinibacillus sp. BA2021]|nr:hypothetical protein [Aneurinibacillus sp. BA2021]
MLYNQSCIPDAPLLEKWPGNSGTHVTEPAEVVVQWGDAGRSACDRHSVVLNGREAITNAMDDTIAARMLEAAAIPYVNRKESGVATIRRFIAIVFQQSIISVYRSSGRRLWLHDRVQEGEDTYEEITFDPALREMRRLKQYAVRSVYALGLDFAAVYAGVDVHGAMRILRVAPTFTMTRPLARKFIASVEAFQHQYRARAEDIVLGTDIEFVLRNPAGKLVLASDCFTKEGMVGCDRAWLRGDESKTCLPLAELRPTPADDAKELFKHLYRAMLTGVQTIGSTQIAWLSGGMPLTGYPMGGHIHFTGVAPTTQLLRALDAYLTLSVFMIESPQSLKRRPKYGRLGDMRVKSHGGFEYRTLPSFLASPQIARGVLALSHVLAYSYRELRALPLLAPELHHAFYHGDRSAFVPLLPALWEEVRHTDGYARYASYLDPFALLVLNRNEWCEHADIRPGWKLPPFQPELVSAHRAYEHSVL